MNRPLLAFLLVLLLFNFAAAFSTSAFSIRVEVDETGRAHILERVSFFVESNAERNELVSALNYVDPQLLEFKKFSKYATYHISGSISNVKIIARRDSYDSGSVEWEYDVLDPIFSTENKGSRLTKYSLKKGILAFDNTQGTRLNEITALAIELPNDAIFSPKTINPRPKEISGKLLMWSGPFVSKEWQVEFEREKSLTDEVKEFFADLYAKAFLYIPLILLSILLIAVIIWFEKFLKAQNAQGRVEKARNEKKELVERKGTGRNKKRAAARK